MKIVSFIIKDEHDLSKLLQLAQEHLGIQPAKITHHNKKPTELIKNAKQKYKDEFNQDF